MFWKKRIFLDHAAGALPNPNSAHDEGRVAKEKLEQARVEIARLMEVKADDIIFTGGATEANALTILGLPKSGEHVLYLPSAHASVVENVKLLLQRGIQIEALPIKDGRVDIEVLKRMLRPETSLVTMDTVCGETGTIWNTREVKSAIGNIYLHVDASQAPLTEKVTRSHFSADLVTLDGGKVGVRGVGCLVAHRTIPLAPLYAGGGQERGLRSGTENVEAILAFTTALAKATHNREAFKIRAENARDSLANALKHFPGIYINVGAKNIPHILNISLPGKDTDYLAALLNEAGFAVSTKSACESNNGEGSRAVLALTGDSARAASTLRISWGPTTSDRDLLGFATVLHKTLQSGLI